MASLKEEMQRLKEEEERRIEITKEKIREAAGLDASNAEIAFHAGMSVTELSRFLAKDDVFQQEIMGLRNRPTLTARKRVIDGIDESYSNAMDYLKRKRKNEFSERVDTLSEHLVHHEISEKRKKELRSMFFSD